MLPCAGYAATEIPVGNTDRVREVYFSDKNYIRLDIELDGAHKGYTEGFSRPGITLVSIQPLFSVLGGNVTINQEAGVIKGSLPTSHTPFSISIGRSKASVGDSEIIIPESTTIHEGEAYIETGALEKLLPVLVKFDPSRNKLSLYSQAVLAKQQASSTRQSPAEHVIYGISLNNIEMEEFVETLEQDGERFLSLEDLIKFFEFPIVVKNDEKRADGWFINESYGFHLDQHESVVRGRSEQINEKNAVWGEQIYLRQDLIERWFGLTLNTDKRKMLLNIQTKEVMPFEAKKLREKKKAQLSALTSQASKDSKVVKIKSEYEALSVPVTDFNIIQSFSKGNNQQSATNYSVVSRGDIAHLGSNIFLAGDLSDDAVREARVSFGRKNEEKGLLGPLDATQFEFGDIDSHSLALVGSGSQGRGIRLSNRSLYRPDQFDVTSFIGNATPGWDAELYRNGVLLDAQTVGSDGNYRFLSVPILFGRNNFRVVLYGPQGQIQEVIKEFYAGNTLLDEGDFSYNLSLDDKAQTLLGATDFGSQPTGPRSVGEVEYGFSKYVTGAIGIAHVPLKDRDHNYVTSGIRASLGGILGSLDNAYDTDGNGYATRLSLFSGFYDVDIRLQQAFYDNFISEEDDNALDPLSQTSSLDLNSQVIAPFLGEFSLGVGATKKLRHSGNEEDLITNRISKNIYGVNLTNVLSYDFGDTEILTDSFTARGFIGSTLIGAGVDYDILPKGGISRLNLEGQFYYDSDVINRTTFTKNLDSSSLSEVGNIVTVDMRDYGLSFITNANTNNNYFVGVGLNFSFSQSPASGYWYSQNRPMADSGAVSARAFIDRNNNNMKDADEKYIEGAGFKVGSAEVPKSSRDETIITQLAPDSPALISLNTNTLNDPMYVPAMDGASVLPRSGHTDSIEFPVQEASEIEGNIYLPNKRAAKGIHLLLVNESNEMVSETTSEFDGYYLFSKVLPGTYYILKAPEEGKAIDLSRGMLRKITIDHSDFYTGINLGIL